MHFEKKERARRSCGCSCSEEKVRAPKAPKEVGRRNARTSLASEAKLADEAEATYGSYSLVSWNNVSITGC
jgi:hypothetical protein